MRQSSFSLFPLLALGAVRKGLIALRCCLPYPYEKEAALTPQLAPTRS